MTYFAHSGSLDDKSDWQTLPDHLSAAARLAADLARPLGLEKAAQAAGLFHDLGKYDPDFQRRLQGATIRVDHSTAGAKNLCDLSFAAARSGAITRDDALMAQLLGYCVLGHHAGLPDRTSA